MSEEVAVYFFFIYFLCLIAQLVMIPIYIVSLNKGKKYKLKKMICSTLFVIMGALACPSFISDFNKVSIIMIAGLIFSWIGDLLLAISLKGKAFLGGMLSFMIAHILFITSFSIQNYNSPTKSYRFEWYEILIVTVLIAACFIVKYLYKLKLDGMGIPVLTYAIIISVMVARAISLAIYNWQNYIQLSITVIIGSIMFLISDAVLVFIVFANKHNKINEAINISTYYIAQIAFSLFIGICSYGFTGSIGVTSF